jgi:hypothetical protein
MSHPPKHIPQADDTAASPATSPADISTAANDAYVSVDVGRRTVTVREAAAEESMAGLGTFHFSHVIFAAKTHSIDDNSLYNGPCTNQSDTPRE